MKCTTYVQIPPGADPSGTQALSSIFPPASKLGLEPSTFSILIRHFTDCVIGNLLNLPGHNCFEIKKSYTNYTILCS